MGACAPARVRGRTQTSQQSHQQIGAQRAWPIVPPRIASRFSPLVPCSHFAPVKRELPQGNFPHIFVILLMAQGVGLRSNSSSDLSFDTINKDDIWITSGRHTQKARLPTLADAPIRFPTHAPPEVT
ncbi:protein of unknown function [Paraburkholderia dioscoreae]|uniref:Uncharacterized protein n=1 Tax=Paraburkholderia dioscoreae TaxID=2604047 RepID=A0A5Q4Z790_9BURK|nr:protein of unknown function [Paraburkholderia dioscoreae]